MPSLVMRAPFGSLLEKTNRLIVRRQIQYATGLGLPWGISESAYNARDKEFTYQYSNFGVPGLGFKARLERKPRDCALCHGAGRHGRSRSGRRQLRTAGRRRRPRPLWLLRGARLHAVAPTGWKRLCDRARLYGPPPGHDRCGHRQRPSRWRDALALSCASRRFRPTELLLQERAPRDVAVAHPRAEEVGASALARAAEPALVRRLRNPHAASPSVHLLSNGRYSVMLTAAGLGLQPMGRLRR